MNNTLKDTQKQSSTPQIDLPEGVPALQTIYFYITEGCNLKCRHCWLAPQYDPKGSKYQNLSLEGFQSIITQAKDMGLHSVKLTGGEPFLHPDITSMLEYVKQEELRVVVESNGVLVTPDHAALLKSCKNPFISVSLDGANAETHEWMRGVPGCFDAAIKGAEHLVDAGFKPQIIMALMKQNVDQIEDVIHLAEDIGAGSVKFNIIQPTSRGKQLHEASENLSVAEFIELGKWVEETLSKETKLRLIFSHPMAFRSLHNLFGENSVGCGLCGIKRILGVIYDGSYALCGIGEAEPDLIFGHWKKDVLKDMWITHPIINQIREGLPDKLEGICTKCIMKNICLGSCVAQNYYQTKSLWSSFWFCEQAYEQGLFPTSRLKPQGETVADEELII